MSRGMYYMTFAWFYQRLGVKTKDLNSIKKNCVASYKSGIFTTHY